MAPSLTVESARVEERAAAFRLIFQHQPHDEREQRLELALDLVNRGEFDPAGILIARSENEVVAAMLFQLIPGASGLLWPPQTVRMDFPQAAEDALLQYAVAWLQQRGAKLGQALLHPPEVPLAASLERNGFQHITRLWYLRRSVRASDRTLAAPGRLTLESYRNGDRDQFHQTLLHTYAGSLDCPEVNGVRELNEIIIGHQAQGKHDPDLWWLAREEGQPVGVVLMTEMPEGTGLEIAYVGIVPQARNRGLGRELVARALAEAEQRGAVQVTLSVDERNHLAWNLYQHLGFEPYEQREVYLAVWKPARIEDRG